ncbi:DUF1064 domain-containing protein [Clostridium beijerinckii]|uniref:DUF1064 domain-containing protein n=1 Tax=Clostridium beijerinckii TaxID=1520 RepID=UPI001494C543|nr:DUF1064 domain-containing protein [Clostridium beijerinckii]NOW03216.1 hypothetical protein [Clostridium beijerinckii]NYC03642.1 hypothetical protein [Clostridium beijerinckii]
MGHYRGKKCECDGYTFDSIPEKECYLQLKNDESVSELQVHQKFIILEGFRNYEGKSLRSITFKPDFMFSKDGQVHIQDVKPLNKKLIDADFMIRWKLLQWVYREQNVKFRLVAWDKKANEFVEI